MELWYLWVLLGVIFLIVEIFTPGFIVGTFGLSCFVAAVPAYFHAHFLWQLFAFSVATIISFLTIRPLYLKYLYPQQKQIPTNVDALIGQVGVVEEAIDVPLDKGRVKIKGEDWKASSRSVEQIPAGTKIKVEAIEGVTLFVVPISEENKK